MHYGRKGECGTHRVRFDAIEQMLNATVAAANLHRLSFREALGVRDLGRERLELALGLFSETLVARHVETEALCQPSLLGALDGIAETLDGREDLSAEVDLEVWKAVSYSVSIDGTL